MTEAEWEECGDPGRMLAFARRRLSPRRLRLLAVECVGLVARHTSYAACHRAIEVARQYADGRAARRALADARRAVEPYLAEAAGWYPHFSYTTYAIYDLVAPASGRSLDGVLANVAAACGPATERYRLHVLGRARELVGHPSRLAAFDAVWRTPTVLALAEGVYADRAFHHLPVLADALEEAGCADEAVIGHCRGPGPHVRGCWVVDLVLGKS